MIARNEVKTGSCAHCPGHLQEPVLTLQFSANVARKPCSQTLGLMQNDEIAVRLDFICQLSGSWHGLSVARLSFDTPPSKTRVVHK